MSLSEEGALLRVALLVARADGHSKVEETATAVQALPYLFNDLSEQQLRGLLLDAEKDITDNPEHEVMERILSSLPGHGSRVSALKVACSVAGADQMLTWQETSYLSRFAEQLGLSRRDIGQIVKTVR